MRVSVILFAAGLFGLAASCGAQQPLSQAAFRDAVVREISHRHPELCVRPQGESGISFGRSAQNCDEGQVSTAYAYRQYTSDPSHQSSYVDQLATTATAAMASLDQAPFAPVRDRIVAVLRPTEYTSTSGSRGDPHSSIWRPFIGDFVALLAQYDDGQIRSIRGIDLQSIGLTEAQAWDIAIGNLRQRIGPLTRTANPSGAEAVTAASGLAPSSLLLPETCTSRSGDFDVYIVQRDTFFYADASKPQATAMLASYAAQLVQSDQGYSRRLMSCLRGGWYSSRFNGSNAWLPDQPADTH